MNEPLVSIIIPHRDQIEHVLRTIDYCVAQTYKKIEIIVVDDHSPHEVVIRVRDICRPTAKLIELAEQRGPAYARNAGFAASKGTYIQFLDADDYIAPEKIALQLNRLQDTGASIATANWRNVFCTPFIKIPHPIERVPDHLMSLLNTIVDKDWFPIMACLLSRALLEKVGPWDEADQIEDRNYRFRILTATSHMVHIDTCLFHYNLYPEITRGFRQHFDRAFFDGYVKSNIKFIALVEEYIKTLSSDRSPFLAALNTRKKMHAVEISADRQPTPWSPKIFLYALNLRRVVRSWLFEWTRRMIPTSCLAIRKRRRYGLE